MNEPFPLNLLPSPLCEYVREGADALGCDPSYIGVPMLPVVASAIGNTRRILLKKKWSEPSIIWAAIVGESGTAKSPALENATLPIWRRQRRLLKEHDAARAKHEAEKRDWKAKPKKDRGEEPESPPPCEHPISTDITIEAECDRLQSTTRGNLIAPDELGGWFGGFTRYRSESDVSHWLSLWGGRSLKVDRKNGDKPTIYIPYAAACITGTIQPDTLRRALIPEFYENGLAARVLVAMPPIAAKRWTEHEISYSTERAIDQLFDRLFCLKMVPAADGHEPSMIDLTSDARIRWAAHVDQHGQRLLDMHGAERAAAAKLEAYAARFALIFHCVRQANGEKQLDFVDRQDIEHGIALADWFGQETRRVYAALGETSEARERRELLDLIQRHDGRVTARQVTHHCSRFATSEAAEMALRSLVDEGLGSFERQGPTARGGRPTFWFVLADSPDYPRNGQTITPKNPDENEVSVMAMPYAGKNGKAVL